MLNKRLRGLQEQKNKVIVKTNQVIRMQIRSIRKHMVLTECTTMLFNMADIASVYPPSFPQIIKHGSTRQITRFCGQESCSSCYLCKVDMITEGSNATSSNRSAPQRKTA